MPNNIKKYRESKKISQTELAKRLGMNRFYLNKLENGKATPSLPLLYRIAAELEVPLKDLLVDLCCFVDQHGKKD